MSFLMSSFISVRSKSTYILVTEIQTDTILLVMSIAIEWWHEVKCNQIGHLENQISYFWRTVSALHLHYYEFRTVVHTVVAATSEVSINTFTVTSHTR
jgi:hypothetical protein